MSFGHQVKVNEKWPWNWKIKWIYVPSCNPGTSILYQKKDKYLTTYHQVKNMSKILPLLWTVLILLNIHYF